MTVFNTLDSDWWFSHSNHVTQFWLFAENNYFAGIIRHFTYLRFTRNNSFVNLWCDLGIYYESGHLDQRETAHLDTLFLRDLYRAIYRESGSCREKRIAKCYQQVWNFSGRYFYWNYISTEEMLEQLKLVRYII